MRGHRSLTGVLFIVLSIGCVSDEMDRPIEVPECDTCDDSAFYTFRADFDIGPQAGYQPACLEGELELDTRDTEITAEARIVSISYDVVLEATELGESYVLASADRAAATDQDWIDDTPGWIELGQDHVEFFVRSRTFIDVDAAKTVLAPAVEGMSADETARVMVMLFPFCDAGLDFTNCRLAALSGIDYHLPGSEVSRDFRIRGEADELPVFEIRPGRWSR